MFADHIKNCAYTLTLPAYELFKGNQPALWSVAHSLQSVLLDRRKAPNFASISLNCFYRGKYAAFIQRAYMINVYIGFDSREAIAYHVCSQSILSRSSQPVSFTPLALNALKNIYSEFHDDGSNAFIYSRFLVPYLQHYKGWAIFIDGDMICLNDIAELWGMRDDSKAVMVIKHDYKTKHPLKYLGNKNQDYPRKNWSSVMLINCEHPANKILTPKYIENATGAMLHRFAWLKDDDIGELPIDWNWLAKEFDKNYKAKLIHYTIGTPCFKDYQTDDHSDLWWREYYQTILPLTGHGEESYS